MVILDAMEKTAGVRLLQTELNDRPGVCLKMQGALADAQAARAAAEEIARRMHAEVVIDVIAAPDPGFSAGYEAQVDFNPLFAQATVNVPRVLSKKQEKKVAQDGPFAVGLIETQGFTAVFEALDTALKAASVEVLAREKTGRRLHHRGDQGRCRGGGGGDQRGQGQGRRAR